jgi:hypothetical protein
MCGWPAVARKAQSESTGPLDRGMAGMFASMMGSQPASARRFLTPTAMTAQNSCSQTAMQLNLKATMIPILPRHTAYCGCPDPCQNSPQLAKWIRIGTPLWIRVLRNIIGVLDSEIPPWRSRNCARLRGRHWLQGPREMLRDVHMPTSLVDHHGDQITRHQVRV